MRIGGTSIVLLAAAASSRLSGLAAGQVILSEIADKGSDGACDGGDWIELHNGGAEAVDLAGYSLHDDKGPTHADAYAFPAGAAIGPDEFLTLCAGGSDDAEVPFGIGGSDQVTLRDAAGVVVSSTGGSLDGTGAYGVTLAFDPDAGTYAYTRIATPGAANIIAAPLTPGQIQANLVSQNEEGTKFFNMDEYGMPVEGGLPAVLDLHVTVDEETRAKITGEERAYETYSPFLSAHVTALNDPTTVYFNSTAPGRIRPKGQSTMYLGVCMNKTTPYQLDWDNVDPAQTFFGMEKTYLRTAFSDPSFVREWASHRMLARFGLPHLRTRHVRFHINGDFMGVYALMEAPDQDYVFKRSFKQYDPEKYGMYKVKTQSVGCGFYKESALEKARARVNETAPYMFARGEHRPKIPVIGEEMQCFGPFINNLAVLEKEDVVLAYVRSGGEKCGKFLVDEGLIDRDLGDKSLDETAAAFVDAHLANNVCDDKCANSNLAQDVDVTQWLKNLASMAVMLHSDSPLGNGNNWYMAWTGDGRWRMVQYDHNNIISSASALLCGQDCMSNLMNWSIIRPTCHSFERSQMAGPLLSDDSLRAQYVEHVKDFVDNVANEELFKVVEDHLAALKDLVTEDPWYDLAPFFESMEMAEGENWMTMLAPGELDLPYIPFLPALRARISEVKKQLEAIDAGIYPRSNIEEYNKGETCVDWTTESAPDYPCPNNCYYQGCADGLTEQPFCDPQSNTCLNGELNFGCVGVPDGQPAPGGDGSSFCFTAEGFPVAVTPCPPYEGAPFEGPETATDDSSGASSGLHLPVQVFVATLVAVMFAFQ